MCVQSFRELLELRSRFGQLVVFELPGRHSRFAQPVEFELPRLRNRSNFRDFVVVSDNCLCSNSVLELSSRFGQPVVLKLPVLRSSFEHPGLRSRIRQLVVFELFTE